MLVMNRDGDLFDERRKKDRRCLQKKKKRDWERIVTRASKPCSYFLWNTCRYVVEFTYFWATDILALLFIHDSGCPHGLYG